MNENGMVSRRGAQERVVDEIFSSLEKLGIDIERDQIQLERPNDPANGDFSCNIALAEAGRAKRNPRQLASDIISNIEFSPDFIDRVEVAGPGFINFSFSHSYLTDQVVRIYHEGMDYGSLDIGKGSRILIEFVSANPTGPLVLVSARAATVGSALVKLYEKAGYQVESEYYLNDAGSQIDKLGVSLMVRFRQRLGEKAGLPEDCYPGDYLVDIAGEIPVEEGKKWLRQPEKEALKRFSEFALSRVVDMIREDLKYFEVEFDSFFPESKLHRKGGEVEEALKIMKENEMVYEKEGALWFRSTRFGDEKDRVLVRSDNTPTYFLADAAYHLNKLRRGYHRAIDIFGPDHHGHIKRLEAASEVFGADRGWLEVLTVQWVRLIENGKQVSMSKREGEFITLRDLVSDVGRDAVKFFFLMRKNQAHMDFNLSLARKQSDENPVYYVQYAHARISSIISFAGTEGVEFPEDTGCARMLKEPEELELIRKLVIFPQLIEGAVYNNDVNRLTSYAQDIAASFHHFYHICRVISSDRELSGARLLLSEATRIVLAESLRLIGVEAPERM